MLWTSAAATRQVDLGVQRRPMAVANISSDQGEHTRKSRGFALLLCCCHELLLLAVCIIQAFILQVSLESEQSSLKQALSYACAQLSSAGHLFRTARLRRKPPMLLQPLNQPSATKSLQQVPYVYCRRKVCNIRNSFANNVMHMSTLPEQVCIALLVACVVSVANLRCHRLR